MIPLDITFNPELWSDDVAKAEHVYNTNVFGIAVIDNGTTSGKPSVFVRVNLGSGEHTHIVMAQTSARLFCSAAKMIMAKYPDLFKDN